MGQDWKDILSGLQDSMGQPGDTESEIEPSADTIPETEKPTGKRPKLNIFYEKKGRNGKPATIITGFDSDREESLCEAEQLASMLKKRLGCGGSARGGEILLQGDRREQLRT
ncbi:MAG: translation initiation factor, partial [Muribaculaceae bacterium]|nr:translation initiation factor [Muribaculaceae bacterium]